MRFPTTRIVTAEKHYSLQWRRRHDIDALPVYTSICSIYSTVPHTAVVIAAPHQCRYHSSDNQRGVENDAHPGRGVWNHNRTLGYRTTHGCNIVDSMRGIRRGRNQSLRVGSPLRLVSSAR